MKNHLFLIALFFGLWVRAQQTNTTYKKRILEQAELETLFSYYSQDGQNAAVTGGEGTEELTDATSTLVLRMPLNEDAIVTIDAGISAYSSASTSNIDPFDGRQEGSPFQASSGASQNDILAYFNPSISHYSDSRNFIWNANAYVSNEYDYFSIGFGGGITQLFNERNTEISLGGQVFLDSWKPQYPIELRPGYSNGIFGYEPDFTAFENENRNSYSLNFGFSQILSQRLQFSLSVDAVFQEGLLSTPFQRIYFQDKEDFFQENFQLADDVEQLPNSRVKLPIGGRLNYYVNDWLVLRSFYRYYWDDWGLTGNTAQVEAPIKLNHKFTIYPTYRYYQQSGVRYFYQKEEAVSTMDFYTSDFDLSSYTANQYGLGLQYKDVLAAGKIWFFGLKSINLRYAYYTRNNGLDASIITLSSTFILDNN